MEQTIFAGGNFWCVQDYFDQVPGVVMTTVGYCGGDIENPTKDEVASDTTGHAEAILIEFDATKVTFETLCRHFFRLHDPTQLDGQGDDQGTMYRSAIFYVNEHQKEMAEKVRGEVQSGLSRQILTQIEPAGPFYNADAAEQKHAARTGEGKSHVPYSPLS